MDHWVTFRQKNFVGISLFIKIPQPSTAINIEIKRSNDIPRFVA